jgi:hypothetical protein
MYFVAVYTIFYSFPEKYKYGVPMYMGTPVLYMLT